MIKEPFAEGNSQIHRLDPRVKFIFSTLYSFVVALSSNFSTLFLALFLSCVLIILAKYKIKDVMKRLLAVNLLILFLWLVVPVTFGGEAYFHIGPLSVSKPGLILSARITLKSNAILLVFIAGVASVSIATLGQALTKLRIPGKIVYMLLLTYRYLFVIEHEYNRLVRSAKIRGFRPGTNVHTYKTYAYLIGMLFVQAAERAQRVHNAMLCRGFKGKFYSLREFSLGRLDWFWASTMSLIVMGLVVLEWT